MNGKRTVERVELLQLKLPYVHFFETSLGREEEKNFILVKVTAEGLCGYGEVVADTAPLYSYETVSTAWPMLRDFLVPSLFRIPYRGPRDFYEAASMYRGHPMAKAGLEMALWDLEAKKEGQPLWKLYGGTRREVPVGVSVGIQDSVDELLDRIQGFLEEGYRRIKIKIKHDWDIGVCEAVRNRFPEIPLQADANGAYTIEEKEHLRRLDAFDLLMVEQPFAPYDLWDHARLQKEMATSLCLDESILNRDSARKAVEMGSCRVINIKPGRVGGIVEARRIHDFCAAHGLPVWCGGMMESGIGRAHNIHLATLPGFSLPHDLSASKRYFPRDLVEPPFDITPEGMIETPSGPGIGVEPREDRIEEALVAREVIRFSG